MSQNICYKRQCTATAHTLYLLAIRSYYNHERVLSGEKNVTCKNTQGTAKIALAIPDELVLEILNTKRDWCHAEECVEPMSQILEEKTPEGFAFETGVTTTLKHFIHIGFVRVEITLELTREEAAVTSFCYQGLPIELGRKVRVINKRYFRPIEVNLIFGNPTTYKQRSNWNSKYHLAWAAGIASRK